MRSMSVRAAAVCALVLVFALIPRADASVQTLPFSHAWTNTALIATDDNWSSVPGIVGYRGDGMAGTTAVDPRTVVADAGSSGPVVDVNANQTNPNTFTTGGVAEFHLADPVVALQGSATARAPHLVVTVSTTGLTAIRVSYQLRDIDGSTDNAVQPVALQFRVGTSGNYTNVPAAYVSDASSGPSLATLVTPVNVLLPAAAENKPVVQLRIITTDAVGSDEWIGVDDISVTGTQAPADAPPSVVSTDPADGQTGVLVNASSSIKFSESVNTAAGAFTVQCAPGVAPAFGQSPSPATVITLTPATPLPYGSVCTVTAVATEITDVDGSPDAMAANYSFSFTTQEAPPQDSNAPVVISQVYGGGGNSNASFQNDYVELYNRTSNPIDITGWTLQYTSADGDSWEFNRQPLGGTIGGGEYLLIALASGSVVGRPPLPEANIAGIINMSATTGKVALVSNFDALSGHCPTDDPDLVDFVGYGTDADCSEGLTRAPAPSNTTALFRLGNGSIDFNRNGSDFVAGTPNPRRTAPIVELGPGLLNTDPRNGGVNAPKDATIAITFTEPVDVDSGWFSISCETSGLHGDATFAENGLTQYITPNVNFVPGENCTVSIVAALIHDEDTDDAAPKTDMLPSNYAWTFKVAPADTLAYPPSVHLTMGNPSGASADQPNNYLMEKPEYTLSYNRDKGGPNWVSWHLSDDWVGSLPRFDTFRPDPAVPADWYRVNSFDFANSGFDRGHMVPNADRDKSGAFATNQATFLMSNMLAQAPGNNQGPWADLENYLRTLLPANEIYVVAGGAGIGGIGRNGGVTSTLANGHVTVPASTWKVALVLPKQSGDDAARVTCSTRSIAVIMPNDHAIENADWQSFLTTVDAVESLTGYDLFSSAPSAAQRCVEAGTNGENNKNIPRFSGLAPVSVELGSADVTIRGTLGVDGVFPSGNVAVTFNGSTLQAPIDANGEFQATFAASALTLGSIYPFAVSYAGDANFTAAAAGSAMTVVDTTAPQLSAITLTPDSLSMPIHKDNLGIPNHKMFDVFAGYTATDLTGATCSLSVVSNEAIEGLGDGDTSPDWFVLDAHRVQLRAERSGLGSGRIYTITVTCRDTTGNTSQAAGTVTVQK